MTCQIGTCIFEHNKNWMKETSVRWRQHWLAQKKTVWKILTPHAMLAVVPLQHGFAHTSDPIHFATNNNYFTSHGQAISVTVLKMHVWALHYFIIQTHFNTRDYSHAPVCPHAWRHSFSPKHTTGIVASVKAGREIDLICSVLGYCSATRNRR